MFIEVTKFNKPIGLVFIVYVNFIVLLCSMSFQKYFRFINHTKQNTHIVIFVYKCVQMSTKQTINLVCEWLQTISLKVSSNYSDWLLQNIVRI